MLEVCDFSQKVIGFNLVLHCIQNNLQFFVWHCNTVLDLSDSLLSNLCIFITATKQTNYFVLHFFKSLFSQTCCQLLAFLGRIAAQKEKIPCQ